MVNSFRFVSPVGWFSTRGTRDAPAAVPSSGQLPSDDLHEALWEEALARLVPRHRRHASTMLVTAWLGRQSRHWRGP